MTESFRGTADQVKESLANAGMKYGLSIGRRAPMHRMHADCIEEIAQAGLKPVIFIGSINGADSQFYDPLRNPMTMEQQKAQLKAALPQYYDESLIITQEDKGNPEQWFGAWMPKISGTDLVGKTVVHYRSKAADKTHAGGAIRVLSSYMQNFSDRGFTPWESFNRNPADDEVNATDLRKWDLNNLTAAQRAEIAAPDYLIQIANEARASNPDRKLLDDAGIPVTMLDLSLDRFRKEAGVSTATIVDIATASRAVNLETITSAANSFARQKGPAAAPTPIITEKPVTDSKTVPLKVASASLNQTIVNFTRNVPNILAAIDKAAEDKADVLSLQELGLTGYTGDDYFKWIRKDAQQQELLELLQYIADYAQKKDPNLVISVGFPFFYADKKEPVMLDVGSEGRPHRIHNPLYNITDKPFNAVATISGGKIHAISAKSSQPEGAAEYEGRQFLAWPEYLGTKEVTLYDGQKVPFGKPIVQIGRDSDQKATIYHEICAEAWPGIADDGTINKAEQMEGRFLAHLARSNDISLVINPSASKPEPMIDKPSLRRKLCETGSEIAGGAGYVYTNCNGLEAAPVAFEAGSIFASDGKIVHTGERYGMNDVLYSSATMDVKVPQKGKPDVVIEHEFRHKGEHVKVGGPAQWEVATGEKRVFEEQIRNTALWLRDYLKKTGQQGFFISLSGGMDSAFGAVAVTQMIDLDIARLTKENGGDKAAAVSAFLDQFDNEKYGGLLYAGEVKAKVAQAGAEEGIDFLKSKMLSCAYFPSENSSKDTENAARFLIEGGQLPDGRKVKGIGGTFHIMPVQDIVDTYIEAYAGADKSGLTGDQKDRLRTEVKECIDGTREALSDEFAGVIKRRILSWKNKKDDLPLQNIQARARAPMAWLFGNDEHKIACVTSNWSEAVAGYWTFAGDGHMGSINLLGGIAKSDLRQMLPFLQNEGLTGMPPVESLHLINGNKASAELRKLSADGKIVQFDEDDMMPYEQLDAIARKIIIGKNSPVEGYRQLWLEKPTFKDGKTPLFSSKEQLIKCIEECCWRWHGSQFKRVAAVVTPFLGQNVDPHTAVRTTILSDGFITGRAALKLEYTKEQLGGEEAFKEKFGQTFGKTLIDVKISTKFRRAVMKASLEHVSDAVQEHVSAARMPVAAAR